MVDSHPLVSLIIPTYNNEKTIKECIMSIVNQDYTNKEIIVVNDNSSDNTIEILKELKSNYNFIKIINFNENKGSPVAMNSGFEHSAGDLIYFMDADAELTENFLEKSVSIFSDKEIDVLTCGYTPKEKSPRVYEILFKMNQLTEDTFVNSNNLGVIPGCFLGFKRNILDEFKFNEKLRAAYDQEFLNKLIKNNKKIFFSSKLYVYHPVPRKLSTIIKRTYIQNMWRCRTAKLSFSLIKYQLTITLLLIVGIILLIFQQYLIFLAGLLLYQVYLVFRISRFKIGISGFFKLWFVFNIITLVNITSFISGIFLKPKKFWKD
ncbi:MAG: glycosyltransferase family 2 protein [Candidatus Helarchaeota archaeon]